MAKDENLKMAIYRARVQMLERPGADQVKYEIGNKFIDEKMII